MKRPANSLRVRDFESRRQARLFWTACILGWCALVTMTASSISVFQLFPFLLGLQMALVIWGPYALATPLVLRVAHRFPLNRKSWRSNIWLHILAALIFALACETTFVGLIRLLRPQTAAVLAERQKLGESAGFISDPLAVLDTSFDSVVYASARLVAFKMQFSLPLYWVLVGVAHSLGAMATLREREKQTAQLTAHLTRAQLAELRAQLHPHFLFNTLNSIAALIPRDAKLATEMVVNLSDLLRMTLRDPQRSEIRLSEELALLRHYVDIQRLRFGERLSFHVEAGGEALTCHVPPLLLQPLVENAILHAVERSDQTEHVTVLGRLERGRLILEVSNTLNGASDDSRPSNESTGLGLANTRARLRAQFGDEQCLEAAALAQGGFRVRIEIPARATATPAGNVT